MNTQKALRRTYHARAIICAIVYAALTFGMKIGIRELHPEGLLLIAMAVAPALAIIAYFLLFAWYMMQVDEYQRHRMTQALLITTGVMLSASSVMDFLQAYAAQPPLEPFLYTVSFMFVFVVAQAVLTIMDKQRS